MNDKRDIIIQSAINILERENYQNMRTYDVAKDAGIAEGTLYRYFKNKRELFVEVIKTINFRLVELFFRNLSTDKSLLDNLRSLGENFFLKNRESRNLYKILYKAFSEVEDQEVRESLGIIYRDSITEIKNLILKTTEKEELTISDEKLDIIATMLWGIGDVYWKKSVVSPEIPLGKKEIEGIISIFMQLLVGN